MPRTSEPTTATITTMRRPRATAPVSKLTGIDAAVEGVIKFKLAGTRGAASRACQLRKAVATLREVRFGFAREEWPPASPSPAARQGAVTPYAITAAEAEPALLSVKGLRQRRAKGEGRPLAVEEITPDDVRKCIAIWRDRDRLAQTTINIRLSVLTILGVSCEGLWLSVRLPPKWWLAPEKLARLVAWLREECPFAEAALVADYVEWTAWTGLRVEETLRLAWGDVRLDLRPGDAADGEVLNFSEITVPGTKTKGAQASLAIGLIPALVLQRRLAARADEGSGLVFPISYGRLRTLWQQCRAFLGVVDTPLATLKALRRTAARNLTTKGMPTEILRNYLRHANIETTMGYLRLVGGYSTAEQRRWL